ncbi:FecR family protein [Spirosoma sp. SC4-14]|uniref:FecR family protein n=1 Tax=Spirosoma sp. SC4-14 TaxID=3128900 RepID=UPI0030D443AE
MPPSPISPILLDKYLRNQCTDQEKELVEAWYASLNGTPDYLDSLPDEEQQRLQNETFSAIQHQIDLPEQPVVNFFSPGRLAWLAASIALLLGLYGIYRYAGNRHPVTTVAHTEKRMHSNDVAAIRFVNQEPRLIMHRLPDNSTVWMHSGASITYPKSFAATSRQVTFSGEGFFDIQKDKTRPFLIRSGEMQIKVLGTSFNVKAPASHRIFQISVVTGRVQVTAPDKNKTEQQIILHPQQQAIFETDSRRLVASAIPLQNRHEIYEPVSIQFDNTPINEVVKQLEKRFSVQIRLQNPKMSSCLVNADFEHQPLPSIMEMLCTALDATYSLSGNVITLDGLPCN